MSATVFDKRGSVLTAIPDGRLDTATSPVFEKELLPYLDDVREVVMDFSNVEYVSSGGLRVLLATQQRMEKTGGVLKLIHVNEHVLAIFDLVGFMDVVTVVPD